jgi:hypothetical protein
MNVVLDHDIDFRVLHVRGFDNPVASTTNLTEGLEGDPGLRSQT